MLKFINCFRESYILDTLQCSGYISDCLVSLTYGYFSWLKYFAKATKAIFLDKLWHIGLQKQPPELFYEKRCSWKFSRIHRKTPVPESLFQWSCRPQATFLKKGFGTGVFLWILRNIYGRFFYRTHSVVTFWILYVFIWIIFC